MKQKHRIITILMAIALAFSTVTTIAVIDDNAMITAEAASIKLSATSKNIGYKQSFNLSIKNTGSKTVKWSTSNKKVAKIKKVSKTKYKVTGVKPGTATIKAKVDGKTYKCKVTVKNICHATRTIAKGTSHTLGLTGVSGTVKWNTSDKSVASINKVSNKKCKVMGNKAGTATIKAKVGGKTYKCKVTVTNPKLNKTSKSLTVGDSFNLSVSGGKGTPTWSTSDKSIATIKKVTSTKYKVTGKKKGTATIKAKIDGKTLKCTVTVKKASGKTGIYQASDGWKYYYKNGVIQETFTGIVTDDNGSWYVKNGKLQNEYIGTYTYNGTKYNVLLGEAQKASKASTCNHNWTMFSTNDSPCKVNVTSVYRCNKCSYATRDGKLLSIHCSNDGGGYSTVSVFNNRYSCTKCRVSYWKNNLYAGADGNCYEYIPDSCPGDPYIPGSDFTG